MAVRRGSSILENLVQVAHVEVTQGGADAYADVEIATGISTAARYGWMLDRVEMMFGGYDEIVPTADFSFEMALSRGQQTAMLDYQDEECICKSRVDGSGTAASTTAFQLVQPFIWQAPPNYVVVDPILTYAIDGDSTGGTFTSQARVWYFPVELQELDILRMIAQR